MADFLATCENAARAGGQALLEWRGRTSAKAKGPKDFVTEADLASQHAIQAVIHRDFPDHDFLGEESDLTESDTSTKSNGAPGSAEMQGASSSSPYRWVVDPLDGTMNYVHQLQTFAVSVALARGEELIAGCVFDPIADECYLAAASQGATLNGRPLAASNCLALEEALVAASFPPVMPRGSIEIARFVEVLHRSQSVRRLGSAALNLAYLAAGRLDAYWATSVHAWDIAAGVLLVREAGGVVTDLDGRDIELFRPRFCASATSALQQELLKTLNDASGVA